MSSLQVFPQFGNKNTEISNFIAKFNKFDFKSLDGSKFAILDFNGFDPLRIISALYAVKESKKISDDEFQSDLIWMIAVVIKKGTINNKNRSKMDDAGVAKVNELIDKYNLSMTGRNPGSKLGNDEITFTRVAAAFPIVTIGLLPIVGARKVMAGAFSSGPIPDFMCHQAFAAIVPRDLHKDLKEFLLALVWIYSCDVTAQSTGKMTMSDEELKTIVRRQKIFIDAAHNAMYPGNKARTEFLKTLNPAQIFNEDLKGIYSSFRGTYADTLPRLESMDLEGEATKFFGKAIGESPL